MKEGRKEEDPGSLVKVDCSAEAVMALSWTHMIIIIIIIGIIAVIIISIIIIINIVMALSWTHMIIMIILIRDD